MAKYTPMLNEAIILENDSVRPGGSNGSYTDEIVLTNTAVVYISKGFWGKIKETKRIPLDRIKKIDNEPQISVSKDKNDDWQIEINHKDGYDCYVFGPEERREVTKWYNRIYKLTTGHEPPTSSSSVGFAIPGSEVIAQTLKETVDVFRSTFGIKGKTDTEMPKPEKLTKKCIGCSAPLVGIKGQAIRCQYCDTEQVL